MCPSPNLHLGIAPAPFFFESDVGDPPPPRHFLIPFAFSKAGETSLLITLPLENYDSFSAPQLVPYGRPSRRSIPPGPGQNRMNPPHQEFWFALANWALSNFLIVHSSPLKGLQPSPRPPPLMIVSQTTSSTSFPLF